MVRIVKGVAFLGLVSAVAGCGVVYKKEVIVSACVSSGRTYDDALRVAKVDGLVSGPGTAEIRFIPPEDEPGKSERGTIVECAVDLEGELGKMKVGGEKVEGERLEAAREAFRAIARSSAWQLDR